MFTKVIDFIKPPEYESIERTQKARFLHIALFVTTITCLLLGIQNLAGKNHLDIFLFVFASLSFLGIPANKRGYYAPVAIFIAGLMLVLITFSLMAGVGLKDAGLIAYPIFIVFASYLFSKKVVLYTTLLSILSIAVVYYWLQAGYSMPARYTDEGQFKVIIVLLPAAGFLLWAVMDNWEGIVKSLRDTYDLTLAGWGQALEYRDRGTQGHSQRGVEATLVLAKRMGIPKRKLEHIRRGALLHDIGKMATPDAILLKKGSLTEDEWKVVKMHPIQGRNMLQGIPFLKPALEIPYGHHERWDGSGYPEGLCREEIPLAARIFAVVDVWDALTSDRPYRPAWPESQALEYIRAQSGKLFDPQVVEVFLDYVGHRRKEIPDPPA